jgi:hypothetical protein
MRMQYNILKTHTHTHIYIYIIIHINTHMYLMRKMPNRPGALYRNSRIALDTALKGRHLLVRRYQGTMPIGQG